MKEKRKKAQETVEQIAEIEIILDKQLLSSLKGNHLLDQIKIFKNMGAPILQGPIPKYVKDKKQALVDAVELYDKGVWVTDRPEDWESDSDNKEFGFEGIDNESSDIDSN